ncbi:Uncharacterised protein [BD1-7 clade bacterium]|uniref:Sulfate transporter n=1 Tax=BD1-7 clade bacterium TaxID=2029982 RepID=A0A5S9QWM9_9GAMM|nr:Uncharacterised protein [BD1-7 clade bacterium]CAA0122904.1 Uncharacterised protein [BD1-7 clade bacterium]
MTAQHHIPEGYMQNALGHLVPINNVSEQDKLRDQIVNELVQDATLINAALKNFKAKAFNDIDDLVEIAADRFGAQIGGKKGNLSLASYDGKHKIQRTVANRLAFSEELEAAKTLILACINRWTANANAHIHALVDRAFKTNRNGELKTAAILDLLTLEIDDQEWSNAMEALKESIFIANTATYIRVYERIGTSDNYRMIPLDLASVLVEE